MGKLKENLVISYDFNEKHRLLLNRYPLLEKSLLIVAKPEHFEAQNAPLDFYDIEAILLGFKIFEKPVIFFNGGAYAGASQPHKHLQMIPMESFDELGGMHLDIKIKDLLKDKEQM